MYRPLEYASKPSGTNFLNIWDTRDNGEVKKKYKQQCRQPVRIRPKAYLAQIPQQGVQHVLENGAHADQSRGYWQAQYIWHDLSARHQVNTSQHILRAPTLDNAGEQCLLWIVCNVRTQPVDNPPEVAIRKTNNLGRCHARFE
jgi:hypothetical protein